MSQRVIAHIDMNCFYASCEEKHKPELRGKPLAISGEVSKRHGIIVTANYPARKFGVKTTMRVGDARKLCPGLITMRPNFERYQEESKKIFDLVRTYTEKIEIVSIDEAYVDLTDFDKPLRVMATIQRRIYKELGMPSSVGVSYTKFFAKMASDLKKPLGFTIINKKNYKDVLWSMDVGKMHGCGKAATKKLKKQGIETIGDIAGANEVILYSLLGVQGLRLKLKANGQSTDKLTYKSERKSIGNSKTYATDLEDEDDIAQEIKKLSDKVSLRATSRDYVGNNISITIKFDDFKVITRSKKIDTYINSSADIYQYSWDLILENYDFSKKVRLLGVSLNDIKKEKELKIQLNIFSEQQNREQNAFRKLEKELKEQFGNSIITNFDKYEVKKKEKTVITTSFSKDFLD